MDYLCVTPPSPPQRIEFLTPQPLTYTTAMLYLVGLGLNNEKDITVNGLEVVRRAERVYLEAYTAILMVGKEKLVNTPLLSFFKRF